MDKPHNTIAKLSQFFRQLLESKPKFFGSVEVNFHDGNVPNVNVKESVKLTDTDN